VIVSAALLSVAAALYVGGHPAQAPASTIEPRMLLGAAQLPAEKVNRIILERRGEPALAFERSGQGWTQIQPVACPVNSYSIDQLTEQAGQLRVVEALSTAGPDAGVSAAALSLDPPEGRIAFFWPGASLTLELGRKGIGGRAYLRVAGGETIYVVNQDLHERALGADPKEWRDRAIFHDAGPEADRVEIVRLQERIVLQRDARRWMMLEPASTRTDATGLDDFFAAVERAQCSGFVLDEPVDLARFGLDKPAGSLTIIGPAGSAGAQQQRLLIGSIVGVTAEDRFGMLEGRPMVIRLSEAVLTKLFPAKEKLASSTVSGVDAADVSSLRISGPGGDFRLLRDLEKWSAPDHGDAPVPAKLVVELLGQLTTLRATKVAFAEYPRDRQVAFITLSGFDDRPRDTVRIARDAKTGNWAMDDGDNVLRIFPDSLKLRLTPGDFGLPDAPVHKP
jgi:hypothetical protein